MENMMPNQMPMVGGMMDNQMPQVGGMMQPPMMPKQAVLGAGTDCSCGGPMGNPYGPMGAGMQPYAPMQYGYPGTPGMEFNPAYGYQMGMGPQGFMNPYGAGPMGGGYGMPMPRQEEESNEN